MKIHDKYMPIEAINKYGIEKIFELLWAYDLTRPSVPEDIPEEIMQHYEYPEDACEDLWQRVAGSDYMRWAISKIHKALSKST